MSQKLVSSFGYSEDSFKLTLQADDLLLDIDKAISLGLVINELVTNALKHAFDGIDSPRLDIRLAHHGDHYELEVTDNGTGLPKDFDLKTTNSFGLKLIRLLTEELNGTLEVSNGSGSKWLLRFPT